MPDPPQQSLVSIAPSTSTSLTASSFTLFPLLPTEIRLHIWRFALPDTGRVVELRRSREDWEVTASPSPPAVFSVNQESRDEVIRYSILNDAMLTLNGENQVYFNYELDTLSFNTSKQGNYEPGSDLWGLGGELYLFVESLRAHERQKVQHLAVIHDIPEVSTNRRRLEIGLAKFKSLKLFSVRSLAKGANGQVLPSGLWRQICWGMREEIWRALDSSFDGESLSGKPILRFEGLRQGVVTHFDNP